MTSVVQVPVMQVDVFTNEAFAGNPAAVCLLEGSRPDAWMSRVAKEMNCANTAFAEPNGDGSYRLRWFTAGGVEVALCGHATLATAHVLYEQGKLNRTSAARFHTQSGLLAAEWRDDGIELDFPIELAVPVTEPDALKAGLGAPIRWVGRNRLDYVVELESETAVRELKPDLSALATLEVRGVVVTARGDDRPDPFDYVLRWFGPRVGVAEDMVTGTAHCALGPYWAERLEKMAFRTYQASPRGGVVRVRVVTGDAAEGRVKIGGQAVTILRGELLA